MNFINYNGSIQPANQAVLTVGNRGFKYGDGLFESMRFMRGELRFADLHAERLYRGMKALKLEGYYAFDEYFLKDKVRELVKRNDAGANARIRLTVYRDSDGLYSPTSNQSAYALELTPTKEEFYIHNSKGLIVDVYQELTKPINFLSNHKTCNSLPFVMAGIYRTQKNLDEVFILNQNGFLCEAMSSNVFVLYDKKLYTPALTEGCIAGVMRQVVMQLAEESGLPVIEAQINPDILNVADEVFLTNASRGIQWVMGFNNRRYFNQMSKDLQDLLNNF
ncbi:aminotransferase class IV [Pedobacter sp. SYSU D00535]|uniref:aminotransferase class IV n=1 Tax=Pedobacter sp. SYSU D00535 TaxID=2810308 RepID=UPI001A96DC92|nr:aminotransferase class IV [Pedobacter sp. SYSU D00535]